jgi:hypothetical protein
MRRGAAGRLPVNRIRSNDDLSPDAAALRDASVCVRAKSIFAFFLSRRNRIGCWALPFIAALVVAAPRKAHAEESIIKRPGDHPHYVFEAEPHLLVGFAGPFKDKGKGHLGVGFRGTIVIVDNGFVKTINNSVGISFGADLFVGENTVFLPVAMQWNFWLSTHWSVFGEPGLGFALTDKNVLHPILMAGGRFHFSDTVSLTMRIGYPSISVGVSFFF